MLQMTRFRCAILEKNITTTLKDLIHSEMKSVKSVMGIMVGRFMGYTQERNTVASHTHCLTASNSN